MINKGIKYPYHWIILIIGIVVFSFGFWGEDRMGIKKNASKIYKPSTTTQGGKHGDSYRLNINNINMPLNRTGVIADVNIPDPTPGVGGAGGKFGGNTFLFSSGLFLSGYSNGTMFANAVASASLVQDYLPGTVEKSQDPNAVIYVIKATDEPFGQSWLDWKDAVDLGADFYDGDGDGIYDPVDKNGNGIWDPDEDAPDMLGDETVWCVYHDGVPSPQRRWNAVNPIGIEIRQTVFALLSKGPVGNIIFLRYRIKYVGLGNAGEPDKLDDMYFGVWADPDLGDATDDRVGSDTVRNAGYTYNDGSDANYGTNPPAFFINFFQGPLEYIPGETFIDNNGDGFYTEGIDTPLDTAYSVRGRRMNPEGPVPFPGARNQSLSSFVLYINGDPQLNDPSNHEEARNYILGTDRTGQIPDPCIFPYGEVVGSVDCEEVDPKFWFSGDPISREGWLSTVSVDVRQMSNTGPFTLYKDTEENRLADRVIEKEIVVAYVVGQGSDHLNSISEARQITDISQNLFDSNFPTLPAPPPFDYEVRTGEDYIDITWPTRSHLIYSAADTVLDVTRWIQGFYVTAFRTAIKGETIGGVRNTTEMANYSINNNINNVYVIAPNGGQNLARPRGEGANLLDSTIFADPDLGRIRFRLTQDPFTGEPLIKGKEYYFSLTQYTLNHNTIVHRDSFNVNGNEVYGPPGDYVDLLGTALEEFETAIIRVSLGEDLYSSAVIVDGSKVSGGSSGKLQYDVVNKSALTGDTYNVKFYRDSSTTPYTTFWRLDNATTGAVVLDSSKNYYYGSNRLDAVVTDGFIVKIEDQASQLGEIELDVASPSYDLSKTDFFYLGTDIAQGARLAFLPGQLGTRTSNYISADRLRKVELRFDGNGKAYRYINGFVGTNAPTRINSHIYAEAVTQANPNVVVPLDDIGLLGQGFVDVPFTAWIVDEAFGEMQQLAVGFMEKPVTTGGNPDGLWNPGTDVEGSGEVIFIFDAPFDPEGAHIELKGNFPASSVVWADLKGYTIPADASASEEQRRIASSGFLNTLYAVKVQFNQDMMYSNGDKFTLPVSIYPYTNEDVFEFQTRKEGALTTEEQKSLFEKVNVFPNPLYGYNVATSYTNSPADEPFVTFSNLPEDVTIQIYTLSGNLIRSLNTENKSSPTSPFLKWDLKNEDGLRIASGLYLAIVSSPGVGEKILKFSIIMPQKQLQRF